MTNLQDPTWLCHVRLGHLNFRALKSMAGKQMAEGLLKIVHPNQLCKSYLVAKQTRIPFPLQTSFRADKPPQLVHADLCGPINPTTLAGNKYFMLIADDYIRWMWMYVLVAKSNAFGTFNKFKALAENSTGHSTKMLRTDRAGEFLSKEFSRFCEECGIEWHLMVPYTPQKK